MKKLLDQVPLLTGTHDDQSIVPFFGLAHNLGGGVTVPQPGARFDALPREDRFGLQAVCFLPGYGQDGCRFASAARNLGSEAQ
jgi:hypothetical protein